MLGGLGPMELVIIFLIVLLIFGGRKIPEIAKGLGKGIKDFKDAQKADSEKVEKISDDPEAVKKPEEKKGDSAAS